MFACISALIYISNTIFLYTYYSYYILSYDRRLVKYYLFVTLYFKTFIFISKLFKFIIL